MRKYIEKVEPNICDGLLTDPIIFQEGLNIISGENGTLKTKLLQAIGNVAQKNSSGMPPHMPQQSNIQEAKITPDESFRVFAISPKRNSERRKIADIIAQIKTSAPHMHIDSRAKGIIPDQGFQTYPSAGELFYKKYENACREGGSQTDCMESITEEFNIVLSQVFNDYKFVATWNSTTGSPDVHVAKKKRQQFGLESLSVGEQEILSLILNLYASVHEYDIFLIDEPEIHLNWHLEKKLFQYLLHFANDHKKQLIVVTHSRVIFNSDLLKFTQFLFWNHDDKISTSANLDGELKSKLTDEAIEVIKLGDFKSKTIFVEDSSHKATVKELARALGIQLLISECGNSANVKSMFRYSQKESWTNVLFMIDGDNQGNPFPGKEQFIHLDKYCIENYLLDVETVSKIDGKSVEQIKQLLFDIIKDNRSKILDKNKYFDFLFDRLKVEDITMDWIDKLDGSVLLPALLKKLGKNTDDYLKAYVDYLQSNNLLESVFPKNLIEKLFES